MYDFESFIHLGFILNVTHRFSIPHAPRTALSKPVTFKVIILSLNYDGVQITRYYYLNLSLVFTSLKYFFYWNIEIELNQSIEY